jgi:hypothetical protein
MLKFKKDYNLEIVLITLGIFLFQTTAFGNSTLRPPSHFSKETEAFITSQRQPVVEFERRLRKAKNDGKISEENYKAAVKCINDAEEGNREVVFEGLQVPEGSSQADYLNKLGINGLKKILMKLAKAGGVFVTSPPIYKDESEPDLLVSGAMFIREIDGRLCLFLGRRANEEELNTFGTCSPPVGKRKGQSKEDPWQHRAKKIALVHFTKLGFIRPGEILLRYKGVQTALESAVEEAKEETGDLGGMQNIVYQQKPNEGSHPKKKIQVSYFWYLSEKKGDEDILRHFSADIINSMRRVRNQGSIDLHDVNDKELKALLKAAIIDAKNILEEKICRLKCCQKRIVMKHRTYSIVYLK